MAREYRHIKEYEQQILELTEQGMTQREIGERLGFSKNQIKQFMNRYHQNQRKLEAGIVLHKQGRPSRDYTVSNQDKVTELKYILARKDAKIKQLEMENELMRDFLSLTGKK